MHATMPERYETPERTGDAQGWMVPWALIVDTAGRVWIDPEVPLHEALGGTVQVWAERTDGVWTVDLRHTRYRWTRTRVVPQRFAPVAVILP